MDACTNFADSGCRFDDGDAVSGVRECVCCGETAETTADDNHVKRKRGFASIV